MGNQIISMVVEKCSDELMKNKSYKTLSKKLIEAKNNNDIEMYSELSAIQSEITMTVAFKLGNSMTHEFDTH